MNYHFSTNSSVVGHEHIDLFIASQSLLVFPSYIQA